MKDGIINMDVDDGSIWEEIHQTIKFILFTRLEKSQINNAKQI